ncbi:MAG: hypothetical protein A2541_00515 [Candidatus Taylorbacteria bacterium RIFOXYD2_FULL_36_9]|uniref:Uncharacterized protein n=1 Tax=Candidatus Taylorbacteria bacterium RIFOXYD2_FULL_36_9 TaxID=1802338 RepID=A0A1G2PFB3_9BACT|nr:MAG: hypothetical protein A2541_00515 [Candidatus Taylorbacteria bacterium RIFOXYD2_FULL_36_9]
MISKEALDKFKKIYKEHFDTELSNQDALDKATRVLRLVEIVYKHNNLHKEDKSATIITG